MYSEVRARVRTLVGDTKDFPIDIGLHRGLVLSPFLFTIVIDKLTKEIQDEIPWNMLFANDIVLIDESREGANTKLELWRSTSESQDFRLSRLKIEYLHYRFNVGRVVL